MTHCGENKLWQQQNIVFAITRIDFAALVSSRAVRISSRAVRVFPALSLRRVRPSYGTFSLMVARGAVRVIWWNKICGSVEPKLVCGSYIFSRFLLSVCWIVRWRTKNAQNKHTCNDVYFPGARTQSKPWVQITFPSRKTLAINALIIHLTRKYRCRCFSMWEL